jgi:[glutamine synthetase] adenylyltransferase / [glutamine synthetase]-adenylyl-L-tyrosine phosphorylase
VIVQSSTALPHPFDTQAASRGWQEWQETAANLPDTATAAFVRSAAKSPDLTRLLNALFGNSPYLTTLALRHPDVIAQAWTSGLDRTWTAVMAELWTGMADIPPDNHGQLMALLRRTKARAALLIAVADISSAWTLAQVTAALSDLADGCVRAGLQYLLREAARKNELAIPDAADPEAKCGFVIFALGKHGGRELNYSSDIDLLVLFDDEGLPYTGKRSAPEFAVRLTRDMVKILQERTADGYVFRTDLRLRPDPGSTAIAVSKSAAAMYYESYGQNWERAAMIKARAIAGDMDLARGFLKDLESFIWRRSLDFYTLQDIHSIKRQIYAHKGGGTVTVPGHNVKLGRGGIREIEFFAQTQQLIWGGRKPEARSNQTIAALNVLTDIGVVAPHVRDDLTKCYDFLRTLEHRLQMINDEQTQKLPSDGQGLAHIAAFMGFADAATFAAHVTTILRMVETHYAALFEDSPTLGIEGNLVFTGTEDDPDTLETLRKLGFQSPSMVSAAVRVWHTGRAKATKSLRARQILTELMPRLLQAFGKTSEPDAAFMRFDHCMNQINTGVQLLSVFYSNPNLLTFIADIMGDAPQLADDVTRNPALLDYVLEPSFFSALPSPEALQAEAIRVAGRSEHLDVAIDAVRRWVNEHRFQIGAQVLMGTLDPIAASHAITAVAESCLNALVPRLHDDFARQYGHVPNSGLGIIAYGKLGSRELTPTSDLDIVVVYSGSEDVVSTGGPKALPASGYYIRLTQRIVSALTSLSQQGRLFDVDLRLRPNGDKGGLACSIEAFEKYQLSDAWTWEHMALTRARLIYGAPATQDALHRAIQTALNKPRDGNSTLVAIANMRGKMRQSQDSTGVWNIKRVQGGLIDVEFIVQYLLLRDPGICDAADPGISAAIDRLCAAKALTVDQANTLRQAFELWSRLMTMLRLTLPNADAKPPFPAGLAAKLASATQMNDIEALEGHMKVTASKVAAIYDELIDRPAAAVRTTFGDNQPH